MVTQISEKKNDYTSLIMTIYNEEPDLINRALHSVIGVADKVILLFHKEYPIEKMNALQNPTHTNILYLRENLDATVVEEWRNVLLDESYRRRDHWTIILDPDEYLDMGAQNFIRLLKKDWDDDHAMVGGFYFPRNNIEIQRPSGIIKEMVNYPDFQVRLVRPSYRYSGKIHEPIRITGPLGIKKAMAGTIVHDKSTETFENWKRKLFLYRSKGGKDNVTMEV